MREEEENAQRGLCLKRSKFITNAITVKYLFRSNAVQKVTVGFYESQPAGRIYYSKGENEARWKSKTAIGTTER